MTGSRRRALLYVGPPTAWAAHLVVSYALVAPICGGTTAPLHLTTVVFASVAVGAIVLGRPQPWNGRPVALALGSLFVLAIVLQGAANAVVDPCA